MRELLRSDLTAMEGRKPYAYKDSEGFWTIGVGHLVDKEKGGKLPEPIIDALLDHDIDSVISQLDKELPWWKSRSESVQRAMANMVFQMGLAGVLKFKTMLSCLQAGDYAGAKKAALDSLWARQTPNRADSVVALFVP